MLQKHRRLQVATTILRKILSLEESGSLTLGYTTKVQPASWTFPMSQLFTSDDQNTRVSASVIIRKMQLKITMMYHLTAIKMDITKKSTNNKCWSGCG